MSNANITAPAAKTGIACNLMLLSAAIIWGVGVTAQSAALGHLTPFAFNAARFFLGGSIALGSLYVFTRRQALADKAVFASKFDKATLKAGVICGGVLCLAINLMQFALMFTPVAKASFIISLYVIMVPIASLLLFKRRPPVFVWAGMSIAVAGMYFLTLSGGVDFAPRDILPFLSGVGFAAQILVIKHYSPKHNIFALACVQFYVVSAISLILAFIFEAPSPAGLITGLPFILYTGVLSSGVAFILQMKALKTADPTVAAIIFSSETVVATTAGWILLGQILTGRELIGCGLILTAVLVAQIPVKSKIKAEAQA
ncbi:MAG: DMT family transporter [Oscillospiraceae bacterium]|nr:DMT family transporter [Oscillospiraceae bacterium]